MGCDPAQRVAGANPVPGHGCGCARIAGDGNTERGSDQDRLCEIDAACRRNCLRRGVEAQCDRSQGVAGLDQVELVEGLRCGKGQRGAREERARRGKMVQVFESLDGRLIALGDTGKRVTGPDVIDRPGARDREKSPQRIPSMTRTRTNRIVDLPGGPESSTWTVQTPAPCERSGAYSPAAAPGPSASIVWPPGRCADV